MGESQALKLLASKFPSYAANSFTAEALGTPSHAPQRMTAETKMNFEKIDPILIAFSFFWV